MFSLSTSWNASKHSSGIDIIKEIKSIGFDTVELGFTLTEEVVKEILEFKDSLEIKISSIHNACPLPPEISRDKASPDYYSLSSLDESERLLAIKIAKNTIDYAKKFDAKAVVFHIGRVEVKDRTRELAALINDRERFTAVKKKMSEARGARMHAYIEKAMESLEEIVPYAKSRGLAPAVENRYYYREIPLMEELEEIFGHFKKGDLFYWHDVGHAQVFENLSFARHGDFLDKFSNRLIGVHLHDIIYPIDDHKAPGCGLLDFNIVKPYIRKDTIKVIEAHQPATGDEIRRSVEYLTKVFEK